MPAGAACGKEKPPPRLDLPFPWLRLDQVQPFHQTHKGGNIGYTRQHYHRDKAETQIISLETITAY